jgi:hypothetical protein
MWAQAWKSWNETPQIFAGENLTSSPTSKMAPEWTPSAIGFGEPSCSNPERVGRDGFLALRFERRLGKTTLGQCRFRLPLQALTPVELADGTAYLMLLNPTGGIVGSDFLFTQIIQEPHTRVCLTTPSATRVYRTPGQPAVQETQGKARRSNIFPITSSPIGMLDSVNHCALRWVGAAAGSFGMP